MNVPSAPYWGSASARIVMLVLVAAVAAPAFADTAIDAKLQCKMTYADADLDAACERGVDLAARASGAAATRGCARDEDARARACERGIALHARLSRPAGERGTGSFVYSWRQGHGAAQIEIGGYDLLIGDAEKSMSDCMRDFDGSKTPPSCLSGLRVQPKPPEPPPR